LGQTGGNKLKVIIDYGVHCHRIIRRLIIPKTIKSVFTKIIMKVKIQRISAGAQVAYAAI